MSKMNNVWVVAANADAIPYLTTAAAELGEETTLVFMGDKAKAVGAKKAYVIGDGSFVQYIPAMLKLVEEARPELVLTDTSSNGRLAAGLIAARLGAAVLVEPSALNIEEAIISSRMVYGGAAFKREKVTANATVICLGAGLYEPTENAACAEVEELTADGSIKFTGKQTRTVKSVNLAAAKRIIGVGRGLPNEETLEQISKLAAAVEAEVGCTRPIAEEEKLMPRETYIGVSGVMCKPEFYMGIGISGQVQHMVGVNAAGILVAINKDKNAPIFQQCDYGLVASIEEVLPGLAERLAK